MAAWNVCSTSHLFIKKKYFYENVGDEIKKILVFGILIAVFLGCETPTDDSSSSKKKSTKVPDPVVVADSYAYSDAAPYYKINFNGADIVDLTVTGADGKTAYLVKTNMSHSSAVDGENSGYAQSVYDMATDSAGKARSVSTQDDPVSKVWGNGVVRKEHRQAALFNSNPPKINSKSLKSASVMDKAAAVNYGDAGTYTVGTTTKDFWVEDVNGDWITITAKLRSIGQYSYIWVPDTYYDNSSALANDNKLTQAQIDAFSLKFNGTAGNSYNDGIFKWVTNVYGYEFGGGTGGSGGRDGDQHVSILLYDIKGDFESTQTGGVFGYFWGKDYYTNAQLQSSGIKSNYSEIFYIDVHFTDKYKEMIYSTLAHEYQHMINFNRKALEKDLDTSTWYNEMLSMLCEDLLVDKLNTPSDDSPVNRLRYFNYWYDLSGVTDWIDDDDYVIYSYASAYAFGAYAARNFGGPDFIKAMIDSNSVDFQSVTDALVACGHSGYTFDTILEKYGQALVYESTPAGSDVVHFKKSASSTIGGVDYSLSAIKLWDIERDNGNYGPWIYSLSKGVDLRPCGMSMHSSSAWENISGDISFKFYKPSGNVNYYIMFK